MNVLWMDGNGEEWDWFPISLLEGCQCLPNKNKKKKKKKNRKKRKDFISLRKCFCFQYSTDISFCFFNFLRCQCSTESHFLLHIFWSFFISSYFSLFLNFLTHGSIPTNFFQQEYLLLSIHSKSLSLCIISVELYHKSFWLISSQDVN